MPPSVPPPFPDDEMNPYAPPRTDVRAEIFPVADGGLSSIPFTIGDVLSRSWEIYKDRMGLCMGVVIGCYGLNVMVQLIYQAAMAAAPMARNPQLVAAFLGIFGTLGIWVFQMWTNIGQILVLFDIARGREGNFGDVFSGGYFLLRVVVGFFLLGLLTVGIIAVGAIPGGLIWAAVGRDSPIGPVALALGIAAAGIVLVYLAMRISQFMYLIIDRDEGVVDSLRTSIELTRGHAGLIFVLYLLSMAINIGGLFACGIGLIFTLPFSMLLYSVAYLALTGQPVANPLAKGEPLAELEPL